MLCNAVRTTAVVAKNAARHQLVATATPDCNKCIHVTFHSMPTPPSFVTTASNLLHTRYLRSARWFLHVACRFGGTTSHSNCLSCSLAAPQPILLHHYLLSAVQHPPSPHVCKYPAHNRNQCLTHHLASQPMIMCRLPLLRNPQVSSPTPGTPSTILFITQQMSDERELAGIAIIAHPLAVRVCLCRRVFLCRRLPSVECAVLRVCMC
jgi:hypothetical protein